MTRREINPDYRITSFVRNTARSHCIVGVLAVFILTALHARVAAQESPQPSGLPCQQSGSERAVLDRVLTLRNQLSVAPNSVDALAQFAGLFAQCRLHSMSVLYWQRASKLRPADPAIQLALALELMEAGRNSEAVAELQTIVPQSVTVLTNLGAALARDNRLGDAITAYRKALTAEPQNSVVLISMAKSLVSLRRYSEALSYITRYRQFESDEFEGLYVEGLIYRKLGQETTAIQTLQHAVARNPDNYDAQWNLGAALLASGQLPEAIQTLRRAIQIKPAATEAHSFLARAYHRSGSTAAADAEKEAFVRISSLDRETARLDMEGKQALSRGDAVQAIEIYRSLINIAPHDARAYYDLALSYEKAGLRTEERESLSVAEKMDSTSPDIQNQLGFLDLESGRADSAEAHLVRAIAQAPQHTAALSNLAVLYAQTGKLDRAETLLRLALDASSAQPKTLRNLALVIAARGRYHDAAQLLEQALALSPEDDERAADLLVLREIQQANGGVILR
jgi:Flp pilus assembly protein TadD